MVIKSNKQWRHFKTRAEVPADILESQFDWLDAEDTLDGFIHYKRQWYHLAEFCVAPESLAPWEGYHADSYFSGLVLNQSRDGEEYQIGRYMT